MGKETINTLMYCQLDLDSAHVMTELLGRVALVGATIPGQPPAIKRHKLAAFAPLYPSTLDYSIRVYCVEDTDAAVQVLKASSLNGSPITLFMVEHEVKPDCTETPSKFCYLLKILRCLQTSAAKIFWGGVVGGG